MPHYRVRGIANLVPAVGRAGSKKNLSDVVNDMAPALTREQVASAQLSGDYLIKSEKSAPALDTSEWPLLLKNYDKLLVRSSHFTPIPSGCSPLKRDIVSYVKYANGQLLLEPALMCVLGLESSTWTSLLTPPLTKSSRGSAASCA